MSFVIAKRIISFKYFHSVWLNNRICFEFHTTKNALVRSVSLVKSVKSSNVEESNAALTKRTRPVDFFGIESDIGVIQVPEKAPSCAKESDVDNSPTSKERMLQTSFGQLRFDSDNQPTFHGQFEENMAETASGYGNNAQVEKIQNVRTSRKRGRIAKLEKFYMYTSAKKSVEEMTAELPETKIPKSEILLKNSENVEKMKVTRGGNNKMMIPEPNEVVHKRNELSFIDEAYFGNEVDDCISNSVPCAADSEEFNFKQNSISWRENSGRIHENNVDQCSEVPEKGDINQMPTDKDTSCIDSIYPEKGDIYQLSTDKETGYIDSIYFGKLDADLHITECAVSDSSGCSSGRENKLFVEEKPYQNDGYSDLVSDLKTQRNISTNTSFIDSQYFETLVEKDRTSVSLEDTSIAPRKENVDESVNLIQKATEPGSADQNKIMDNNSLTGSNQVMEENLSSPLKQSCLLNVAETDSTFNEMSEVKLIEELDQQMINLDNTQDKAREKFLSSRAAVDGAEEFQHSAEKLGTAFNYVLKLRKTEDQKGSELGAEGSRNLKNRVPDLSKLTRNELLDLLKDNILFSNEDIVILNKPYNLVLHESQTTNVPSLSSVLNDLAQALDTSAVRPQLYTVHRLDKETTGCLLLARNELAAQKLKSLFAQRQIEKKYLVITTRVPNPLEGIIDMPIAEGKIQNKVRMALQPDLPSEIKYKCHLKNGKKAVTHYKVVSTYENAALVEVKPETGIKHQIRVHLGFGLNCPILGDHKYSHLTKLAPQRLSGDILRKLGVRQSKVRNIPMHIHAQKIIVPKFLGGRDLFISAPLPEHIIASLKSLKSK